VDEAAADPAAGLLARVAAASGAVSFFVGDRRGLLDVDVHQLPGPVPHIAAHRVFGGGPVASVEAPEPLRAAKSAEQNRLNRRRVQADFDSDVVRSPATPTAQVGHLGVFGRRRGVRGGPRAARAVLEPVRVLGRGTGRAACERSWRPPGTSPPPLRPSSAPSSSKAAVLRRPTGVSAAFGCRVLI